MRISDWSSDVCSSDLRHVALAIGFGVEFRVADLDQLDILAQLGELGCGQQLGGARIVEALFQDDHFRLEVLVLLAGDQQAAGEQVVAALEVMAHADRSEEHTSEIQSLMRISYAVFCLKKKNN